MLCLIALLAIANAAPAADQITSLPGWTGPLPSAQYSGYLDISSTKHIHYWFVYSENNPSTDPVVLWLNGGPGCSSLDGFIYEHGPFGVNANNYSQLYLRDYRWSLISNVLYFEAPVGVGFSYSDDPKNDYICTDDTTANDNLLAVQAFFAKFPEFSKNNFFITGESYAGIYVPTLAEAIMHAQQKGSYTGAPLKGIGVGNGCSGDEIGICGFYLQGTYYEWQYLTQTAFIPTDLKNQINTVCDWANIANNVAGSLSVQCEKLLQQASNEIANVNLYNIYGDCVSSYPTEGQSDNNARRTLKAPHKSYFFDMLGGPDACIDSFAATAYFNRSDVQKAIHVRDPGFTWGVCSDAPGWQYTSTRPNLPRDTYPSLIDNYRVTIYNGDWDACVPYTDNQAWTEGMKYQIQSPWHHWNYTSESGAPNQVAGYAVKYKTNNPSPTSSFQFITIRGGRHEVPESAPGKALEMLRRIIYSEDF